MEWPQITYIVLTAITGTITLLKNGETKNYNFGLWILDVCVVYFLLIKGGFFGG